MKNKPLLSFTSDVAFSSRGRRLRELRGGAGDLSPPLGGHKRLSVEYIHKDNGIISHNREVDGIRSPPPPPELLGCGEIAGILTLKTLNRAKARDRPPERAALRPVLSAAAGCNSRFGGENRFTLGGHFSFNNQSSGSAYSHRPRARHRRGNESAT